MSKLAIVLAVVAASTMALGGCGKKKPKAAVTPTAAVAPPAPARGPTPTPTPAPPAAVAGGTGVPACDEFLAVLGKALACDQLASSRAALQANFDNQKRRFGGWPALAEPARTTAMTEAAAQCKGGVDGIRTTMASAGCAP